MKLHRFFIISPFKGPRVWLDDCISSVKEQNYPNSLVHHLWVDDKDGIGAMLNHWNLHQEALSIGDENSIVIHLDGDDRFLTREALNIVNSAYQDDNVWVTFGNYLSRHGSVCKPQANFRERIVTGGWCFSHPRTFRLPLAKHLTEGHLKDQKGVWYSSAPDVALFCPILEWAGVSRVRFIDQDLVYYRIHQSNEAHSHLQDQVRCAIDVYHKPKEKVLESLC